MGKESIQKTTKYEAQDVLADIRSKDSRFASSEIACFTPVYYPIAIVEMQLEELVFEDFETVHLTVLRLISIGITDHKIIAQTLGLSPNYVFKILRILTGFGHINGSGLTELGKQSLKEEKKITTTQTRQKFQVDALEGQLLKVGDVVTDSMLSSRDQTRLSIGHLDHLDGMDVQKLKAQLTGGDSDAFFHRRSDILHANVRDITDVQCVEMKYARCYLLQLKNDPKLYLFAKLYNQKKKEIKDRFSWSLFRVRDLRQFRPGSNTGDHLVKLYEMLLQQSSRVNLEEEVPKAVSRIYPFHSSGLTLFPAKQEAWIDEKAIVQYRRQLLSILCDIHHTGSYLITSEFLYGRLVSVKTNSPKLRALAKLLVIKIQAKGLSQIGQKLREHFADREDDPDFVDEMANVLLNL